MNKKITYITRKSQPQYYSIEGLFETIISRVTKLYSIEVINTKYKGAFPLTILKNILTFNKSKGSVYHITGDVHYMALATSRNTVLTIHDIGSSLHGSLLKRLYIKLFWFWLPALYVKRITVISEFTKKELKPIIPFAKHKIKVVYNPVSLLFQPKGFTFNSECPTILCVGTKTNKNLERIFQSIKELPCILHIVGQLNNNQLNLLDELNINYKNSINLTQQGIVNAYVNCDLLCFPSTYEGFGMPIIEAQATGRPVLTSNFGAMLEVANDSACLVDANDTYAISNGIQKIISNSNYREILINKGLENVKRFQLDIIVQQYIAIYKEIASNEKT